MRATRLCCVCRKRKQIFQFALYKETKHSYKSYSHICKICNGLTKVPIIKKHKNHYITKRELMERKNNRIDHVLSKIETLSCLADEKYWLREMIESLKYKLVPIKSRAGQFREGGE